MPSASAAIWVVELLCSEGVATKINSKHGLAVADVRSHLVCQRGLRGRRLEDPDDVLKYGIELYVRGRRILVVMLETEDPGVYVLKTAYPSARQQRG